jgi:hypothetical protein
VGWWVWVRRPDSRTGALLVGTGFAWFVGNFAAVDRPAPAWIAAHLLYVHRGVLIHAVLSYPTGRLSLLRDRVFVAVAYAITLVLPVARDAVVTVLLGGTLIAVAGWDLRRAVGSVRSARADVVRVAVPLGVVLIAIGAARLIVVDPVVDQVALVVYQVTLCAVALVLVVGLLREAAARGGRGSRGRADRVTDRRVA